MNWRLGAALATAIAVAGAAGAVVAHEEDRRCVVAADAQWMSLEQAAVKLREHGFSEIKEIERDDGCWEAEALNAKGEQVEIHLHPVSGAIARIERD